MMRVDLNCDLGEGGAHDAELLELVTSANIACGFHAGDPGTMRRVAELALRKGVGVGAHPGLRDPGGFGRRELAVDPEEAYELTLYQIGALRAFAPLRHVKPHGALYNMAAREPALAEALARAVRAADPKLVFVGLAGSEMIRAARAAGLAVAEEAFADRGYRADGTLVPRGQPGALVASPAEVARRALGIVREGRIDGVALRADTICVHGDTPGAPDLARALRAALEREGVELRRFG
jgi:UPF0271 protein